MSQQSCRTSAEKSGQNPSEKNCGQTCKPWQCYCRILCSSSWLYDLDQSKITRIWVWMVLFWRRVIVLSTWFHQCSARKLVWLFHLSQQNRKISFQCIIYVCISLWCLISIVFNLVNENSVCQRTYENVFQKHKNWYQILFNIVSSWFPVHILSNCFVWL